MQLVKAQCISSCLCCTSLARTITPVNVECDAITILHVNTCVPCSFSFLHAHTKKAYISLYSYVLIFFKIHIVAPRIIYTVFKNSKPNLHTFFAKAISKLMYIILNVEA